MINKYVVLFVFSIFLASCAQILLKISADKKYDNKIKEYLNAYVIIGYSVFVITTILSIISYRGLGLKQGGVLQTTSYIFIMVLSHLFIGERINRTKLLGATLIIGGMYIFYL